MGIEQVMIDMQHAWAVAQVWVQIAIPMGVAGFCGMLWVASRPRR